MQKWMGACDCIITKAGPGTIAEALIRGLPIILNDYIPGQYFILNQQENGNVPYVVGNGANESKTKPVDTNEIRHDVTKDSIESTGERIIKESQTSATPSVILEEDEALKDQLGTMKNTELFVNVVALAILVISAVANICIQMSTGVIFVFWIEHTFIMLLTLLLLAIACSLSLAIPTTKYYLDIKYSEKLKLTNIECSRKKHLSVAEGLGRFKKSIG
nr:monogalactosyldiacylglycerol synthase type C [Tanacetum cinerariifolium]